MTERRPKSENVTIRLNKNTKTKLEQLAKSTNRSRNFLASEAIDEYVAVNEWQIAGIKKGLRDLATGKSVSHDKVSAWVDSLGTDHELPPPRSDD
jgi:RHH-type transcriptional regulator, rel operon repressor / antitoxin RelB